MIDTGSQSAGPLLELEHLRTWLRSPRGVVRAVDDVSMSVERNTTVGIVGESGSGKSMLMRSIMGLVPPGLVAHQSGSVMLDGVDVRQLPIKERRRLWGGEIGVVFQDPMTSLNPVVRIGRQVTEAMRRHQGLSRAAASERAVDLMRRVEIPDPESRLTQYPFQFSGGMRQRITIAMALACNPKLLIADEPTTALDVTVQAQILALLDAERVDRGMSMLLVTHDIGVVSRYSSEIVVMYGGRVVEKAPTRQLFTHTRMPYTEALLRALPRLEDQPHTRLQAIPGRPPDLTKTGVGCSFSPRCEYVETRCLQEAPPLVASDDPDHVYACWNPVSLPTRPPPDLFRSSLESIAVPVRIGREGS